MCIPRKRFYCRRNPALEAPLNPLRSIAWALLPLLLIPRTLTADGTPTAQIRFTYENPKLQPHEICSDGRGRRQRALPVGGSGARGRPKHVVGASGSANSHHPKRCGTPCSRPRGRSKLFAIPCDDGGKNVAFQGTKTLEYEGPEGKGSCVYNWSKNAQIEKLTDEFEAMAATLDEGSKLQRQYEHGRLSLDSEMEILEQMVHDGRAIEVENIAPHSADPCRRRGGVTAGAAARTGSAAGCQERLTAKGSLMGRN